MYRSVLVPLDGSPFSEQALPLAVSIARRARASLHLVHVHLPITAAPAEGMMLWLDEMDAKALKKERAYLEQIARRLEGGGDLPITSVLLEGPISETIQQHAAAQAIDLIVMTTHGRGMMSRFWLGSVADDLIRRARLPVLLLRPHEETPDFTQAPSLQRILIPLDGSAMAEQILEPAMEIGALMDAEYTLLRVVEPLPYFSIDASAYPMGELELPVLKQLQDVAQKYLDGVARAFRERSLKVKTQVVVNQRVADAILETAGTQGSNLIALATHGRSGLGRLILGSVADKVVRASTLPVLVRRPVN